MFLYKLNMELVVITIAFVVFVVVDMYARIQNIHITPIARVATILAAISSCVAFEAAYDVTAYILTTLTIAIYAISVLFS